MAMNSIALGSIRHEHWLKQFKGFVGSTERRYMARLAESEADPRDTDLARRADLLGAGTRVRDGARRPFRDDRRNPAAPHRGEDAPMSAAHAAIYLCPLCRSTEQAAGRFVRADVAFGNPHFGKLIPCPRCCSQEFGAYVMAHGKPQIAMPEMAGVR
jgi:hypothetical protein